MMQNVSPEYAIGLRVGNKLHHSFHVIAAKRAAIGAEWKFADSHIDPFFLRLIFGKTYASQLGICVNDTSNGLVVHMAGLAREDFDAGDPFVFGFMCQHRPRDYIANGINALDVGAEMFVHFDALFFIKLYTGFFCTQAVREWTTPN